MTERKIAKEEKIISHCNALADVIIAIRPTYLKSEPQQRAFIETMIGAAIWYIPKPANAWTGHISREAMKIFHPESGVSSPKFSEECTGLMKPDTLMRDNNRQPLRCQYESEAQLQTIPEGIQKRGGSLGA